MTCMQKPLLLQTWALSIEKKLDELLPLEPCCYQIVQEAARYALLSQGKRLRPLLTLATVHALSSNPELALVPACAVECVHSYSMIHDDLPCMDNDDFRRGQPTVHRQYREDIAILAGDYLLTHAFDLIAKAPELNAEQKIALVATLSEKAGAAGMIGGQVMDIAACETPETLAQLEETHLRKTGALIAAALLVGGIVAQAPPATIQLLNTLGYQLGLGFQIIDDILDVTASEVKHGKPSGTDAANGKVTYVTLLGVESAKAKALELESQIQETLLELPGDTSMLRALVTKCIQRTH